MSTTNPQSDAQPDDVPRRGLTRRVRPASDGPAASAADSEVSSAAWAGAKTE